MKPFAFIIIIVITALTAAGCTTQRRGTETVVLQQQIATIRESSAATRADAARIRALSRTIDDATVRSNHYLDVAEHKQAVLEEYARWWFQNRRNK